MQTVVIYSTRSMNKSEPLDEHLIRGTCAVFSHKAWQMNNDTYLHFDDFNVLLLFFRHRHPARQTDRLLHAAQRTEVSTTLKVLLPDTFHCTKDQCEFQCLFTHSPG